MEIKSDVGHLTVSSFLMQPHCLSSVTLCGKIWKCFFGLPRCGHQLELEGIQANPDLFYWDRFMWKLE